ncbi:hypothetical protein N9R79_00450 [Vibrio sp.]|nr:hypothetical protein [Vibrio sp.]
MAVNDYFSIKCTIPLNITAFDSTLEPSWDNLEKEIPMAFKIANQFSELDRDIAQLPIDKKNPHIAPLMKLIDLQNQKLNTLLSFMLSEQQHSPLTSHELSAGHVTFTSNMAFEAASYIKVKLFLTELPAAIFAYAQINDCHPTDSGEFKVQAEFTHLLESDEELLIRYTLNQQQKLLKERSKLRHKHD